MNIFEHEEELFSRWEKNRAGFVRDGVVSEDEYVKSNLKIAVILKEVNDRDGGGWDLREFIAKGARWQTWDNVARWVYGIRKIREGNPIPKWQEMSKVDEKFRKETLRSICAINLKKSPGTHTTDGASLWKVATEDREHIKEQYAIYDADLTVCGGTADVFRWVMEHESKKEVETSRGIWWYERTDQKYVLRFPHPEARVQDSLLFYGLLDAVKEIYD